MASAHPFTRFFSVFPIFMLMFIGTGREELAVIIIIQNVESVL